MQNIFNLLAYLLTKHDCVIIPGFGGFVVHYESAHCAAAEGFFAPPTNTIGLNTDLYHNDGLLVNSLMRIEKSDYKTAHLKVLQFVEDIKNTLDTTGKVHMPEIGDITVSGEGKYLFTPGKNISANAGIYGLSGFYLPMLNQLETYSEESSVMKKKDKNVILIPIPKSFIKTVASAAAIILAVLMISSPIDNSKIPTQYAGIIDHNVSAPQTQVNNHNNAIVNLLRQNEKIPVAQPEVKGQEKQPETIITPAVVKEVEAPSPPSTLNTNTSTRSYYIIVSSSESRRMAEKLLPEIRSELTTKAEILEKQDLFRIYIAKYSDKKEAESFLAQFRSTHPKYESAWLLSVK